MSRDASADVERNVELEDAGPDRALSTATGRSAKVTVAEIISDREFRAVNVSVRDSDYKFASRPGSVSLTIRGPESAAGETRPKGVGLRRRQGHDAGLARSYRVQVATAGRDAGGAPVAGEG